MAESAVATLAGRSARFDVAAVAPGASPDPAPDGPQPETTTHSATAVTTLLSIRTGEIYRVAGITAQHLADHVAVEGGVVREEDARHAAGQLTFDGVAAA